MQRDSGPGSVWSVQASVWDAGLAVARAYAEAHGHLLPPTTTVYGGDDFALGVWVKNQVQRPGRRRRTLNGARPGKRVSALHRRAVRGP
ncbi:helicase associated domain-containing protein [Streptomyces arenae]|uniref:helicase associated domain-containing protein n=1 Tax=Streptomyces arenae TaxID=29301 RepID=UPI003D2C5D64